MLQNNFTLEYINKIIIMKSNEIYHVRILKNKELIVWQVTNTWPTYCICTNKQECNCAHTNEEMEFA